MTKAQRREQGRRAVAARRDRQKPESVPGRWYGVVLIPVPGDVHGGVHGIMKILDEAHAKPEVILWTRDRDEARARAREVDLGDDAGKFADIIEVDYDPTRFTIQREYKPDHDAMQRLLRVDLGGDPS